MKNQEKNKSRREFIQKSIAGLAGAALAPSLLRAQEKPAPEKNKILYRTLGRTGIRVPVISMGAQATDIALYGAALDAGLNHFDTANTYNNGQHETMIGQVIKDRPRDSYIITSKVYQAMDQRTGRYRQGVTAEGFIQDVEAGLKRLGIEYVDILELHDVVCKEAVTFEPALKALEKLKQDGKTRFVGLSVHTNEPEVINAAVDSKFHDVILTAYNFRQPHFREVKQAIARAAQAGLGIVAMKTQAGVYWDRERQKQINMKAALKWVLLDENVHTTIPGFTTFDQMNEDISVMVDLRLTEEEKRDIELGMKGGMQGLYCSQCRRCIDQCRHHIDIPSLMRSYMYAYGYRNLPQAKETARPVLEAGISCADCSRCSVRCSIGFDVREKILDIARLERMPDEFLV
ncbi:MAG: aldo/keto reductase [Candidatus Krumholzibacteriota bacterium]|nr:aldo/keto reductase [Candidatus Krumholzibacteriota bacterium]